MLIDSEFKDKMKIDYTCKVMTAAPPASDCLTNNAEIGFEVTHVYGLTEKYMVLVLFVHGIQNGIIYQLKNKQRLNHAKELLILFKKA